MVDLTQIKHCMEVVGADGVRVGTIDKLEDDRLKLSKVHLGSHGDHNHYLPVELIASIDGETVRLSANGSNALLFQEERSGQSVGDAQP